MDAIFPLLLVTALAWWASSSYRTIRAEEKSRWKPTDLGHLAREHRDHVRRMSASGLPLPDPDAVDWDRVVTKILDGN